MKPFASIVVFAFLFATPAFAADGIETVRAVVAEAMPGVKPDSITKAALPDFYEVAFGTRIYYVSADGRFVVDGDVLDYKRGVNLTERRRGDTRLKILGKVDEKSMIIYKPEGEVKHTITVFTDVDCGYCRKLHSQMQEINRLGIEVRYLAFPRAGIGSPSFYKAESVWCSKDRKKAMDKAKSGETVKAKQCTNPVREHLALGAELEVRGTPALVLDDGRFIGGYMPPTQLLQVLEAGS